MKLLFSLHIEQYKHNLYVAFRDKIKIVSSLLKLICILLAKEGKASEFEIKQEKNGLDSVEQFSGV